MRLVLPWWKDVRVDIALEFDRDRLELAVAVLGLLVWLLVAYAGTCICVELDDRYVLQPLLRNPPADPWKA